MADHDRPGRRLLGRDALEPTRAGDPVSCPPADVLADVRRHSRDSVGVVRLDSHDARPLGRPEPDGEHRPEGDRHLPEDVPRAALAQNTLDSVDELDRFDTAPEHGEQRALAALARRTRRA
jgi:hypothetical protein